MCRVIYHEHPRQQGQCLRGAFACYVRRIPLDGYADLDAVWADICQRPFERDSGQAPEAGKCACRPAQRSRIWPAKMNCWEATAHFCAAARRFLGPEWTLHVWDRDLPNGARHLWPSLMTPRGDHLLVDLQTVEPREYPRRGYSGVATAETPANDWWNDVVGGAHIVGDAALRAYGLGGVGAELESVENNAGILPSWAHPEGTKPKDKASDVAAAKKAPSQQASAKKAPPDMAPRDTPSPEEGDDADDQGDDSGEEDADDTGDDGDEGGDDDGAANGTTRRRRGAPLFSFRKKGR